MTAQQAVTPFNILSCSTRSVSIFCDGGRIYGIYVMREGIFYSWIASQWNQQRRLRDAVGKATRDQKYEVVSK